MKITFSKEIYNKEAIIKAAYMYTDKAYVHIDVDEGNFIINIESKESGQDAIDEKEFMNEVLSQIARQIVRKDTQNIRELMLARAFSSTVISKYDDDCSENEEEVDIDDILMDWFEKYE